MDDLDKRFLDFLSELSGESSKLDKMVKSVLLNFTDSQFTEDEVKQEILLGIWEKKERWLKIFATGNPVAYLKTVVYNTVRDMRRKDHYFDEHNLRLFSKYRRKVLNRLKNSKEFRKFQKGKARSVLWYYTRESHENPQNLFIRYEEKNLPDLDMDMLKPDVRVLMKKEKVNEILGYYLGYWECRERMPVAVEVNDFLPWLFHHVDITEVYNDSDEEIRKDTLPEKKNNLLKDEEENSFSDPDIIDEGFQELRQDRDALIDNLDRMLDAREKRCLAMTLQGVTLEDIARAEGYKGPSGAKALRDKAVMKIRIVLGGMGYAIGGVGGETFESLKPFMDILNEFLNFPGQEPSH